MQSGDNGNFEGTKSYNDSKSFNDERNVYREKGSRNYQSHQMTSGISSVQDNR